jgi:hypothetical protein
MIQDNFYRQKGKSGTEKFVSYYLSHFADPDYIFASKPSNRKMSGESASVRPLQTVAPLANELSHLNKKFFWCACRIIKINLQDSQLNYCDEKK